MGPAQASPVLIRFGVFEADLRAGELRRSGVKVRIQDLPFRTLAVLLSRPNEVITREDLRQALWPDDVFVDFDRGISSAIKRLRDALGDSADNPIFIETIERRGYRWIGPVQGPELSAKAEAQSSGVSGGQVVAPPPPHASPRWKFIFALPVLLKQMEENEPDFVSPHRYLKVIYLQTADYPRYLVEARSEAVLMHDSSALAVAEATERGFATGGGKDLLETLHHQQTKLYERGLLSPYFLAETCSLQGNKQEALRYLKTAYDQHGDGLFQIETDHAFDNLHNEPAFRQLVAEVGLPPLA